LRQPRAAVRLLAHVVVRGLRSNRAPTPSPLAPRRRVATEPGSFMEVEVDADFGLVGGGADEDARASMDAGPPHDGGAAGALPARARGRLRLDESPFGHAAGLVGALVGRLAGGAVGGGGGGGAGGGGSGDAQDDGGGAGGAGDVVEVVVAYLTSYEHMGRARLSCASGCACEAREVEAHRSKRVSVSETAVLRVRPAAGGRGGGAAALARCVVRAEVLPGTSSGEHKFKVIQVVTRAKAGAGVAEEGAGGGAAGGGRPAER
jgi:hypothetical protein